MQHHDIEGQALVSEESIQSLQKEVAGNKVLRSFSNLQFL
jgi:hypothetical protein